MGVTMNGAVVGFIGVTSVVYLLWQILGRLKKRNVHGKVVLITGASSGLGEGMDSIKRNTCAIVSQTLNLFVYQFMVSFFQNVQTHFTRLVLN